jgi:hypothetical protein
MKIVNKGRSAAKWVMSVKKTKISKKPGKLYFCTINAFSKYFISINLIFSNKSISKVKYHATSASVLSIDLFLKTVLHTKSKSVLLIFSDGSLHRDIS